MSIQKNTVLVEGMKIVRFEPGDRTSYRVLFHRMTPEECSAVSAPDGAVLFGFNGGGSMPWHYYHFNASPDEGFLHISYYAEKMGDPQRWTLTAGLRVFEYLTGREAIGDLVSWEELDWKPNWRDQLAPLTVQS